MLMNKLRTLRLANHYTIADMGKLVHMNASYYWQIENKKRSLYYYQARIIAAVFGMKPDELFFDEY